MSSDQKSPIWNPLMDPPPKKPTDWVGLFILATPIWMGCGIACYFLGALYGLVISFGILISIYLYGIWPFRQLSHIPGAPTMWLLGNMHQLIENEFHVCHLQWEQTYGNIFRFFAGRQPIVVISDLDTIVKVGTRQFRSFHDRPIRDYELRVTQDLVTARGDYWKFLRNATISCFSQRNLTSFLPSISASAQSFINRLSVMAETGETFDLLKATGSMTMQVIGLTSFSEDFEATQALHGKLHPMHEAATAVFGSFGGSDFATFMQMITPTIGKIVKRLPLPGLVTLKKAFHTLDTTILNITKERRKVIDTDERHDFISALLRAEDKDGRKLTDDEIREQSNAFVLAGYETTANTLANCIFLLSAFPDKCQEMVKQIDTLAPLGTIPDYESLKDFTYIHWIINETLRLFAPVAALLREPAHDTELLGYKIPQGTWLMLSTFCVHHNPKYFPDPFTFKPERWNPECDELKARPAEALLAFGLGPHRCIGMRFALDELVMALILLYQRFTFRVESPPTQLPLHTLSRNTIMAKGGIHVTVHERKQKQ